jgi:FtsH-binding integral membrane protein
MDGGMNENPYEAPKVPSEPDRENRRRTFLAVSAPLALPAAAVAFCTMCTTHAPMQFLPMWSPQWLIVVCIFAVAGVTFVVSMIYLMNRWFGGS